MNCLGGFSVNGASRGTAVDVQQRADVRQSNQVIVGAGIEGGRTVSLDDVDRVLPRTRIQRRGFKAGRRVSAVDREAVSARSERDIQGLKAAVSDSGARQV